MTGAGFSESVLQAQGSFRAILNALARPGTVQPLTEMLEPPPPMSRGAAAVALTLCDHDTPVWLDDRLRAGEAVGEWLRFQCGCPLVADARQSPFAFFSDVADLPGLDAFNIGTDEYPDRSTTIVLQVSKLDSGPGLTLEGPGVRDRASLRTEPMPGNLFELLIRNRMLFPRGVDVLLVTANAVAGLPRSVRVVES